MKKFFLRLVVFLSILFIADRVFLLLQGDRGHTAWHYQTSDEISLRRQRILSARHDDLIVLGSSHAQMGIDEELLGKEWGISVSNLGFAGAMSVDNQPPLLNLYLSRKVPSAIIYAIDANSLNAQPLSVYLNVFVAPWLWQFEDRLMPARLCASFRYGGSLAAYVRDIAQGNWMPPLLRPTPIDSPPSFRISDDQKAFVFDPAPISVKNLEDVVATAKRVGAELIFIQVPEYVSLQENHAKYDSFDRWVKQFSSRRGIAYHNFNMRDRFPIADQTNFEDVSHLNAQGRRKFTELLAKTIRPAQSRRILTSPAPPNPNRGN